MTYADLTVLEADGHELSARLEVEATALKVVVADDGARYPVAIDPVAQQADLKVSNTGLDDTFGFSVAVSGDTAVVEAVAKDSCGTGVDGNQSNNACSAAGAAYVFAIVLNEPVADAQAGTGALVQDRGLDVRKRWPCCGLAAI